MAATSTLARPISGLADLVAASATFQTIVGAANAAVAAGSVYWPEASDVDSSGDLTDARPRAVISPNEDFGVRRISVGQHREASGSLLLTFEFLPANAAATLQTNYETFTNNVGDIIDDMFDLGNTDKPTGNTTYMNITDATIVVGPQWFFDSDYDPQDHFGVVLQMRWSG